MRVILLSDQDHKVIESFGCWRLKRMYGKESIGVVRSTYLIDPDGKIAASWDNVTVKSHTGEVRDKLEELITLKEEAHD
jgi:peroxiredoxin Q/BCP